LVNGWFWAVLAALAVPRALSLAADLLNLRRLSPEIPTEFRDVYDAERYARSQDYARARLRFGLAESVFSFAVLLAFWFLGGFGALDRLVRGWNLSPVPAGLAYIGLLSAAGRLLALPWEAWSTFVTEARFGFNRTTPRTFIADRVKGWTLGVLLGGFLLSAALALFQVAGPSAWPWVWLAAASFSLALQFLAPTWLLPLFNKFSPLADGELKSALLDYARSVNFSVKDIYVMDGSKRSSKANAFFTGFGRGKRIALFDTLVQRHSVPELVSVLAHEIGHYKLGHVLKNAAFSVFNLGLLCWLLSKFLLHPELARAFGLEGPSLHGGFVLFGLLYAPVSFAAAVLLRGWSRRHEYAADRYAAATGRDPASLARALKVLSADSLSNLTPHPFYVFLNHTHPPVRERVRVLGGLSPK
jgi:STE24 endopeptidase